MKAHRTGANVCLCDGGPDRYIPLASARELHATLTAALGHRVECEPATLRAIADEHAARADVHKADLRDSVGHAPHMTQVWTDSERRERRRSKRLRSLATREERRRAGR